MVLLRPVSKKVWQRKGSEHEGGTYQENKRVLDTVTDIWILEQIYKFCIGMTKEGQEMPRVTINKNKYLQKDLREFITGRMKSLGKNQAYMGEKLNISQPTFGYRLRKSTFTNAQLPIIFKELEATDEEILRLMKL